MRVLPILAVLGAAIVMSGSSQAPAAPTGFHRDDLGQSSDSAIIKVQLECNQHRCLDRNTGAYTQSGCNFRGCYPITGVVGYTNPDGSGYGSSYPPRQYRRHHRFND
jgi:hypothetical protein